MSDLAHWVMLSVYAHTTHSHPYALWAYAHWLPIFATLNILVLFVLMYPLCRRTNPSTYTKFLKLKPRQEDDTSVDYDVSKLPHGIAVIGAGFCGLGVCASLKRNGIKFECFEKESGIGGNWCHGVYDNVHIISSKKTTEYKDFPMPAEYPDFPSQKQVLTYLQSYADYWGIRPHITLNSRITLVESVTNAQGVQEWRITFDNGKARTFSGVVIANGHHWDCRWAGPYPGSELFTGQLMHSKQYKSPTQLAGKRVCVLGGGNSACDIATEASRFSGVGPAHMSVRSGVWFLPRTVCGVPLVEVVQPWMPLWLQRGLLRVVLAVSVGPYTRYGLQQPQHKIFERHPTINSEVLSYIKLGKIIPHPDIKQFVGGKTVEFVDGKREDFDVIVHATGYHVSVPILKQGVLEWGPSTAVNDGRAYPLNLVNGLLSTTHKHLYVFGLGQPRYGAGPLITAGAEFLSRAIKTQTKLKHPIGKVLTKIGGKPLQNYLMCPFEAFNKTLAATKACKWLPTVEKWLLR